MLCADPTRWTSHCEEVAPEWSLLCDEHGEVPWNPDGHDPCNNTLARSPDLHRRVASHYRQIWIMQEWRTPILLEPAAGWRLESDKQASWRCEGFVIVREVKVEGENEGGEEVARVYSEELGWRCVFEGPSCMDWSVPGFELPVPATTHEGLVASVAVVKGKSELYRDGDVFNEWCGDAGEGEDIFYHLVLRLRVDSSSEVLHVVELTHAVAYEGNIIDHLEGLEQDASWYSDGSGVYGVIPSLYYSVKFF